MRSKKRRVAADGICRHCEVVRPLLGECTGPRTLRLDVALFFGSSPLAATGLAAADEVPARWQQAAGRPAEHVAYWDAAAALCTVAAWPTACPATCSVRVGRPDLNAALLTARRDAFLAAALDEVDSR